jgi:tetratricopeptide (TPR) repeat protein
MRRHLFALLGLLLALPGARALPNDPAISALYARGLAGDREAVSDCITALEKLLAAQPNEQVARVYLGSAYTLRSRDLPIGPAKLRALRKGIVLMDEAAAAAPENATVQLTRAVTNEALPAFLGRRKIAREQLDQLVAQIEKDPAKLTPADQQLLYLNAGEAAEKAGDRARARQLWQRGAALKADSKLTREIEIALASPESNL